MYEGIICLVPRPPESLVVAMQKQKQTSQPATEVCREMWVWSIASPLWGQVYPPSAQCTIIVCPKIIKF